MYETIHRPNDSLQFLNSSPLRYWHELSTWQQHTHIMLGGIWRIKFKSPDILSHCSGCSLHVEENDTDLTIPFPTHLKCTMSIYSVFFLVWSLTNMVLFFYTARKISISAWSLSVPGSRKLHHMGSTHIQRKPNTKDKCHRHLSTWHIFLYNLNCEASRGGIRCDWPQQSGALWHVHH